MFCHRLAQLGDAPARGVLVPAGPDGGNRNLAQFLGPSASGKPCPRLTAPVSVASSDMVAKIVVGNGRRRRPRSLPPATAIIGPAHQPAPPIVAPTVLSIANFNMHRGMDGCGRPFDYVAAIAALEADVIVLQESWTTEGRAEGQAEEAGARSATRS